jgi:hypothetical protein
MRHLLLLGSALSLLALQVQGQQVARFDTVQFNQTGSFALGQSIFELDSGYLCFSLQKGLPGLSQDIFTLRFNEGGGLEEQRSFETYQQDYPGYNSATIAANGSFYSGMSRGLVIGPIDSLLLYKYGPNGDTLWTRFVALDTAYAMRGTAITQAGDVLLTGIHYPGWVNGGNEAFVYCLDSLGAIKSYHGYANFDGNDVVEGKDGSWYVCGLGNTFGTYGYPVLIRSDTLGNELWRRTSATYGYYLSMLETSDSCLVVLGNRGDGSRVYANAIKFDRDGIVQWVKEPYASSYDEWDCSFKVGYELGDSSLVVAGTVRDTIVGQAGMLFHLDKDGNTLWQRFYAHYVTNTLNKDQIFWDVKPTSDGGMVLTGETNSDAYPYAQLWLLKLDSAGCLVPGCGSVGVEEYLDDLNKHLRVWPNPASEVLNLSLPLPEGAHVQGNVMALLLDGAGRIVQEEVVRQDLNHLNAILNVSTLAAGTYYLHLRDGKRWLAGSAVVVE